MSKPIAKRAEAHLLSIIPEGVDVTTRLKEIAKDAGRILESLAGKDTNIWKNPDDLIGEINWYVSGNNITVSFPLTKHQTRSNALAHLIHMANAGMAKVEEVAGKRVSDKMVRDECMRVASLFADEVYRYFGEPRFLASVIGERVFSYFLEKFRTFKPGDNPVELVNFDLNPGLACLAPPRQIDGVAVAVGG